MQTSSKIQLEAMSAKILDTNSKIDVLAVIDFVDTIGQVGIRFGAAFCFISSFRDA
jgi:hypothetical protein